jgi:rare lipoprotein A
MKPRTFALAGAMALALASMRPAAADPVADILVALLGRQEPRLQPSNHDGRRDIRRVRIVGAGNMLASYYGGGEYLNRHTANGERFDPRAMTAAHRTLPFGARLSVCFRGCVVVRVNDRGPAAWTGRSLDLSLGAARAIGMAGAGVARVRVAILP